MCQVEVVQAAQASLGVLETIWHQWPIWAPILIPGLIAGFFGMRKIEKEIKANRASSLEMLDLQERKLDARAHVPIVIEILEDVADLEQAFIFRGRFIEGLEHRCPDIRFADGKKANQMSIAERTHQLRLIARKVLRNCRRVIFLTPKDTMPKTVAVCRSIMDEWLSKEPGKKLTYAIKIGYIGSILQYECDRQGLSPAEQQQWQAERQKPQRETEEACRLVAEELEQFQDDLEACASEEFPTYVKVDACSSSSRPFPHFFRKWREKVSNFWNKSE